MSVKRNKIVRRATELIKHNPSWSRKQINDQLKHEFGKSIRATAIVNIRSEILGKSSTELNEIKRAKTLEQKGFLPEEAIYFAKLPSRHSGTQKAIYYRQSEVRRARAMGVKDVARYIRESYKLSGWTDTDGSLRPDIYSSRLGDILQIKPAKRPQTLLIDPKIYKSYKTIRIRNKFSKDEAEAMRTLIPADKWLERLGQYAYLKRHFFSHTEAFNRITATYIKDGVKSLQPLDFNSEAWQEEIRQRDNYAADRIKELRKTGVNYQKAANMVRLEIQNKTANNKPKEDWDWLKEYYRWDNKQRKVKDFNRGLKIMSYDINRRKNRATSGTYRGMKGSLKDSWEKERQYKLELYKK